MYSETRNKKQIGIDCTGLNNKWIHQGVGIFIKQLVEGLIIEKEDIKIILFCQENMVKELEIIFDADKIISLKKIKIKKVGTFLLRNLQLYKAIKLQQIDLMINPFVEFGSLIYIPCKSIGIVHDLHFKHYPLFYTSIKRSLMKFWIEKIIKNYTCIVSISEYTKKDIIELYKTNADKIKVIGNPVELNCLDTNNISVSKDFILSVNSFMEWKNQITLINAFDKIKKNIPYNLLLIGAGDSTNIKKLIKSLKLEGRVIVKQHLDDCEVINYYKRAVLFVNTSLFEGFGRSNIEAGLLEIPVLSTESMCLKDCSFGMLEYYKPAQDSDVLSRRMLECINSDIYTKERLIKIKMKFYEEYNKNKIARKYFEIIRNLLNEK